MLVSPLRRWKPIAVLRSVAMTAVRFLFGLGGGLHRRSHPGRGGSGGPRGEVSAFRGSFSAWPPSEPDMTVSDLFRTRNNRETGTAGSASGMGKRTGSNPGTAPHADSTHLSDLTRSFGLHIGHRSHKSPAQTTREPTTQSPWDLALERRRARLYEIVLREGDLDLIRALINGSELARLWGQLWIPSHLRTAWQPLIDEAP